MQELNTLLETINPLKVVGDTDKMISELSQIVKNEEFNTRKICMDLITDTLSLDPGLRLSLEDLNSKYCC